MAKENLGGGRFFLVRPGGEEIIRVGRGLGRRAGNNSLPCTENIVVLESFFA
jgi:hypothetical protein